MLEVKNLVKVYKIKGGVETKALDDVSVTFPETGLVFLLGKSGSGKSTLLNMIGGLDRPDSGEIIVKGRSSKNFSQSDFDSYRNTYIGFIFQEYNVLNEFNIEQNISLALQLQGKKNDKEAVNALLKEVDLEGFNRRKPNTLSGGQKQRIAIARALIKQPEIIMADEPTGALDSNTGKQVLETLKKLSKKKLVIIVSHDQDFAEEYGDRIIELKDGKILSDKSKEKVPPKALNEKMQIINGNIIDIKNGSELTEADFKQLYQMIKKQNKEVLISTGEENIKVTKKAARITDDGSGERFSNTKEVKVKEYDGKNTKFIRSHMPFSRAFKMGASGLKSKPFRLIFTILLSVVSFTMFGVVSTLMFYDQSYSLAKAMENMDRTSESITKKYKYTGQYVTIDNSTGEVYETQGDKEERTSFTYFGEKEIKDLNASNNNKFIGVYDLVEHYNSYSPTSAFQFQSVVVDGESSDFYSFNYFTGLSDNAEEVFRTNGYQLTGTYPTKSNEIAISNYHFDLIKESKALGTLSSYNDIVGKTLTINYRGKNWTSKTTSFKITGVYDFGAVSTAYDALKQPKPNTQSDRNRQSEVEKLSNYLMGSLYSTGYVAPSFYEENGFIPVSNRTSIDPIWARGISEAGDDERWAEEMIVSQDSGCDFVPYDALGNEGKYYDTSFKEVEKINLNSKEILLPYQRYASNYAYNKYYNPTQAIIDYLSNCQSIDEEARTIYQDIQNRNEESTSEAALAIMRIRQYFDNKSSDSGPYPEGFDLDTDFNKAVNKQKEVFNRVNRKYYINTAFDVLRNYFDYHDLERPADWNEKAEIANRFYDSENPITESELTTLNNYIKDLLDTNEGLKNNNYALKLIAYNSFDNSLLNSNRERVYQKYREVTKSDDYWVYRNNVSDSFGDDTESLTMLETMLLAGYKEVYGEDASFTYEYNPNWLTYAGDISADYGVPSKMYYKDYNGTIIEFTVKGLIDVGDGYRSCMVRSDFSKYLKDSYSWKEVIETQYQAPSDVKYPAAIGITNYSQSDISIFTKDNGTYSYDMTNAVYTQASFYTGMINQLKTIFLIVGAVTGVLAALLLLNFISVSITSKNKDIGILRAVGARGSDVFKIFFSESSIIVAICFVLAAIGAGVTCFYLNQTFIDSVLGIALLNYGFLNIILILAIAIVISFIATFIPVMIASKKPPVEAIRSL